MAETVKANSVEDVKDFAARNGIEIDDATAKSVYEKLNKKGALSDDDLGGVSGGMSVQQMMELLNSSRR